MLDGIIQRRRRSVTHAILEHYRERYLPYTVLLPNARFGLYAAAREMLRPGDRVLISPITCRTVIDALLAAEVRPVFVDIEMDTGNMDISKMSDGLLRGARAIVTTNLYGNPDCALELSRRAKANGMLLIEDCAHVLSTAIEGRQIGAIGDVSVFSFKKYFDEPGGVATLRNEEIARRIRARVAAESTEIPLREERTRYLQFLLEQSTGRAFAAMVSILARDGVARQPGGNGGGPSASVLSRRAMPTTASLCRVARLLSRCRSLISERVAAARELLAQCPLEAKTTRYAANVCPMVVPFCSLRRDQIIAQLRERGIATYFLYSPAMNRVFGDLTAEHKIDVEAIDHWCRTIFPVDLRYRRQVLDAIHTLS